MRRSGSGLLLALIAGTAVLAPPHLRAQPPTPRLDLSLHLGTLLPAGSAMALGAALAPWDPVALTVQGHRWRIGDACTLECYEGVWGFDAGLLVRPGFTVGRVRPYLSTGIGRARVEEEPGPERVVTTWSVGVGADLEVRPGLGWQVQAAYVELEDLPRLSPRVPITTGLRFTPTALRR